MATKKLSALESPQPTSNDQYDRNGYLPQSPTAYTTVSVIYNEDSDSWCVRQTDVIDGLVINIYDSPLADRATTVERFKIASQEFIR